jgi:nucleoside-diphosphate-sugar epimerase
VGKVFENEEFSGVSMKKALVTGGGGFIGLALTRALLKQGVEVQILGRHRYPEAESAGANCFQGDIRDIRVVKMAAEGCDTVFHVAAKAGIWGAFKAYYETNVLGSLNVIAACRKQSVPYLVYTSTPSVVFDGQSLEGVDETVKYAHKPLCSYAVTKIIAEKEVLKANTEELKTVAIRPHLVWGPGDNHLLPRIIQRGRAGELRIIGDGNNHVDIAYIDNVVHAHLLAAENLSSAGTASGKAFFIAQNEPVNLWQWVNGLFLEMGIKPVSKRVSLRKAYLAGMILEFFHSFILPGKEPRLTKFMAEQLALSHFFCKKQAEQVLKYKELVSTETGMKKTVQWLRNKNI